MIFSPCQFYVEVEPMETSGPLVSDERKFVEKAKVIKLSIPDEDDKNTEGIEVGDIIFFRSHGFFELAEHDGKKHYVVRVSPEFILGIIKHERKD